MSSSLTTSSDSSNDNTTEYHQNNNNESLSDSTGGKLVIANGNNTPLTNQEKQQKLREDIRSFVVTVFQDSQSITLTEKAKFGKLVRHPETRLWFAQFVDEYRVNSKLVSELTFYSLAQYFSIVLFECLAEEDFQPAKIIMNMMFTYYYHVTSTINSGAPSKRQVSNGSDTSNHQQVYLYQFLKDQQIFKSIRFWTSAFYESVISERNNHQVFKSESSSKDSTNLNDTESQNSSIRSQNRKISQDKRIEELNCNRNIAFGLLGSFIHNMMLLGLSKSFCREFLDKHSTISGLDKEQCDALYGNLSSMFDSKSDDEKPNSKTVPKPTPFIRKPLSFSIRNSTFNYRPKFL